MKQCEQGLSIISCAPNILFPGLMIMKYIKLPFAIIKMAMLLTGLKDLVLRNYLQCSVGMPPYIHL